MLACKMLDPGVMVGNWVLERLLCRKLIHMVELPWRHATNRNEVHVEELFSTVSDW